MVSIFMGHKGLKRLGFLIIDKANNNSIISISPGRNNILYNNKKETAQLGPSNNFLANKE